MCDCPFTTILRTAAAVAAKNIFRSSKGVPHVVSPTVNGTAATVAMLRENSLICIAFELK